MLPLVQRMAKAFSAWLAPAYGGDLDLRPDLDQVEGLSAEREALWARIDKASFLTVDEKRAAVGYGPTPREEVEPEPAPTFGDEDTSFVKYDPNQPRVSAGNSDGGQWSDGGGGGSRSGRVRAAQANTGTRNDAGEDPAGSGDETSEAGRTFELVQNITQDEDGKARIPDEPPPRESERLAIVKAVARTLTTLSEFAEVSANFPAWFLDYGQLLRTALDDPKTLEQLQRDASSSGFGYDRHHIVEQTPAEKEGFTRSLIDGPDNLVRIPRLKHWQITGWFGAKNKRFGGISPRDYLRGKDWAEKTRVGREALVEFEVLKP